MEGEIKSGARVSQRALNRYVSIELAPGPIDLHTGNNNCGVMERKYEQSNDKFILSACLGAGWIKNSSSTLNALLIKVINCKVFANNLKCPDWLPGLGPCA